MEPGEAELETLVRELQEELGVQVDGAAASRLCRVATGPAGGRALVSAWLVPAWEGTPANVAPDEHDDLRWFSLCEVPPPPHVVVRDALVAAMQQHRG